MTAAEERQLWVMREGLRAHIARCSEEHCRWVSDLLLMAIPTLPQDKAPSPEGGAEG